jgi:hypothetical protein
MLAKAKADQAKDSRTLEILLLSGPQPSNFWAIMEELGLFCEVNPEFLMVEHFLLLGIDCML